MMHRTRRSALDTLAGLTAAAIVLVAGAAWAGARRIDPQQYTLRATLDDPTSIPTVALARAASMSADGKTAVVTEAAGGPNYLTEKAVVFNRTATGWTKEADLVPSDPTGFYWSEYAVAVSGDGTTVALGAITINQSAGAVYVFHRGPTAWSQEAKLVASDGAPMDRLGHSVALDFDGSIAMVGAPGKENRMGAVYFFQRTGAGWVERQEVQDTNGSGSAFFGAASALSFDGSTALVGASDLGGAALVFRRGASGWSESAILSGTVYPRFEFGGAVALSADGRTALVGALRYTNTLLVDEPTAFVFTQSGSAWSQQAELRPGLQADYDDQAVALNAAGSVAFVGMPGANGAAGEAFLFLRNGSQWSQPTAFTPSSPGQGHFGVGVALSASGDQGVILPGDASTAGAQGWIYGLEPTATTLSSTARSALLGANVTYTAQVSPPPADGTVSFWAGGAPLAGCFFSPVDPATGAATCTTTYASIGVFPVLAAYSGGSAQASSSSAPSSQKVGYGIAIQSPAAGGTVSSFLKTQVKFSLSSGTGPLSSTQDQQISDACGVRVSITGGASGVCGTYDPSTGSFFASLSPVLGASGPATITVAVLDAGGTVVSTATVDVQRR